MSGVESGAEGGRESGVEAGRESGEWMECRVENGEQRAESRVWSAESVESGEWTVFLMFYSSCRALRV